MNGLGSWVANVRRGVSKAWRAVSRHLLSSDAETREEFEFHLQMEIQDNLRMGMDPTTARREALKTFGGTDWHRERVRDERRAGWMEDLARDLRFGARNLRKRPVFAFAGILTLSLGVGMSTTMFALVDSVVLHPLPGSNQEGLVYLERQDATQDFTASPTVQLLELLGRSSSFERVEAYDIVPMNVVVDGEPYRLRGAEATEGFFDFLGVRPAAGRGFVRGDASEGAPVAVLQHRFAEERFGNRENALGQAITIEGVTHEVVGVLSPGFRVDSRGDISFWTPAGAAGEIPAPGRSVTAAIARLADGVSVEAAQDELNALVQNSPLDQLADFEMTGKVWKPQELVDPEFRRAVVLLQAGALLVLLIGCGNLANLLLAQGESRSKELALRASLGAKRGRLVRQLLVESLALGVTGGVGGILVTVWALEALPLFLPPGWAEIVPARPVLAGAVGLAMISVLMSGMVPAIRGSRRELNVVIKNQGGWLGGGAGWGRKVLVAGQGAMAVILLASAGVLLKSFVGLQHIDPGFQRDGMVTLRFTLPDEAYDTPELQRTFFRQLTEQIEASVPAPMGQASVGTGLAANFEAAITPLVPEGFETGDERDEIISTRSVAPGYFETLGLSILQGRSFTSADGPDDEKVIIVNPHIVDMAFPDKEAVGQRIQVSREWYRIVGVVESMDLPGLARSRLGDLQVYFPFAQRPGPGMTVVARLTGDGVAGVDVLKEAIRSVDPTLPIQRVAYVDELLAESLEQERSNAFLMALFALTALTLGAVGIYGVVAYTVSRRIREMGIRLALGASRSGVVWGVVVGGMKSVVAGVAIGLAGAWVVGGTLADLLHEVSPRDPIVLAGVTLVVIGVALLATWLPARRASGRGPIEALQAE